MQKILDFRDIKEKNHFFIPTQNMEKTQNTNIYGGHCKQTVNIEMI